MQLTIHPLHYQSACAREVNRFTARESDAARHIERDRSTIAPLAR
jgi:hypothetical protein